MPPHWSVNKDVHPTPIAMHPGGIRLSLQPKSATAASRPGGGDPVSGPLAETTFPTSSDKRSAASSPSRRKRYKCTYQPVRWDQSDRLRESAHSDHGQDPGSARGHAQRSGRCLSLVEVWLDTLPSRLPSSAHEWRPSCSTSRLQLRSKWRRERDSNPRKRCRLSGFQALALMFVYVRRRSPGSQI